MAPYLAVGLPGLASFAVPVWFYRFRNGPPLVLVERQIGQIWGMYYVVALLTAAVNQLMPFRLPPFGLLPVLVIECAFAFGAQAVILGGSFYPLAAACALLSVLLAVIPNVGPVVFGAVFAVGLLIPARKFSKPG